MPSASRILLAGGFHNEVWKVRDERGVRIEKRYNEDRADPNPMYPNRARVEAAALRELDGTGFAPRLLSYRARGADGRPLLEYEFVPGTIWTRGVADVADLLHRVHRHPVRGRFRRLPASPGAALDHADSMVHAVPRTVSADLRGVRPSFGGVAARRLPARLSFVHTDCGPGNLIRGSAGLLLIDWQCPGIGDAVEDLACFVSPAMMVLYHRPPHGASARDKFLAAYPDRVAVERYLALGAAWHYRIASYCVYRAHRLRTARPETAALYREALAVELALLRGLQ